MLPALCPGQENLCKQKLLPTSAPSPPHTRRLCVAVLPTPAPRQHTHAQPCTAPPQRAAHLPKPTRPPMSSRLGTSASRLLSGEAARGRLPRSGRRG